MPRLRVLAGPSPDDLTPIEANKPNAHKIKTDAFEGEISVFLKNFVDAKGKKSTSGEYFANRPDRTDEDRTWSIQARGRFLKEGLTADDILFGNIFDRALPLPTGTSVAMKFIEFKDPTLEHDLYAPRPWLLSPLFATVQYLTYSETSVPPTQELSKSPPSVLIHENTASIVPTHTNSTAPDATSVARRAYFADPANRRKVTLGPSKIVETDFCHGYLTFGGEDGSGNVGLAFPMIHFDLMKYWDGRPVWYVCCERGKDGKVGPMLWCVAFQLLKDDEEDDEEEEKEAEPLPDNSGDID